MTEEVWYEVELKEEYAKELLKLLPDGYSLEVNNRRFNWSMKHGTEFRTPVQGSSGLRFRLRTNKNHLVAKFSLSRVRGNCGMIVSSGCYVQTPFRGKGIGTYLNRLRLFLCKDAGYTVVMCTAKKTNGTQMRLLRKNGWRQVNTFKNKRTGNKIGVYHRNLRSLI